MEIAYTVVDQKPIDADRTQVVVETALPVVINGYGGGRITVEVDNDQLQDQIEEHVANKFVNQVKPTEVPVMDLIGDLTKVQHIIDAVEEVQHAEDGQQETQPSGTPSDAVPTENPTPVHTPPADPIPSVEPTPPTVEPPAPPIVEQPSPVVDQPAQVVEQPALVVEQPAPVIEQPAPAVEQPVQSVQSGPSADSPAPGFIGLPGGLGQEDKA